MVIYYLILFLGLLMYVRYDYLVKSVLIILDDLLLVDLYLNVLYMLLIFFCLERLRRFLELEKNNFVFGLNFEDGF